MPKKQYKFSEETRNRMSEAKLKKPVKYWTGKRRSEEDRLKMSIAHLGQTLSPERKQKLIETHTGKRHWNWKGEGVGYSSLHVWVKRHKGKPKKCIFCGENKKRITWANIDHKYKRNLNDFIALCMSCHRKYDIKNNKKNKCDYKI